MDKAHLPGARRKNHRAPAQAGLGAQFNQQSEIAIRQSRSMSKIEQPAINTGLSATNWLRRQHSTD
jgi:hypothetical protein